MSLDVSGLDPVGVAVDARRRRWDDGASATTPEYVAARDLGRYYRMLADELAALQLTRAEAYLALDAANGLSLLEESGAGPQGPAALMAELMDTAELADGGHHRHQHEPGARASARALAGRLTPGRAWALLDACERFWAQPESTWDDALLVRLGMLAEGDAE